MILSTSFGSQTPLLTRQKERWKPEAPTEGHELLFTRLHPTRSLPSMLTPHVALLLVLTQPCSSVLYIYIYKFFLELLPEALP